MKRVRSIVVYESRRGNSAAVARAIAQGIGPEACAVSTAEATGELIADADLIVAGAPQVGFNLPTEGVVKAIAADPGRAPAQPDVSHPAMRTWLEGLPKGRCRAAAFETAGWWSPGSAARPILRRLETAGYRPIAKPHRYSVHGMYGPPSRRRAGKSQDLGLGTGAGHEVIGGCFGKDETFAPAMRRALKEQVAGEDGWRRLQRPKQDMRIRERSVLNG